jgi:hypothetical protein
MKTTTLVSVVILLVCVVISVAQQYGTKNLVTKMPGIEQVKDTIYTGYLSVDIPGDLKNALFYYFAESRGNPATDPLGKNYSFKLTDDFLIILKPTTLHNFLFIF